MFRPGQVKNDDTPASARSSRPPRP
jgi:hypothetical protein